MFRFLFVFCLLFVIAGVQGQERVIEKSSDIVVIRGNSYYLHTVQAGQTLYSICKAYGVDLEDVKRLNEKKDNQLSLLEVLKIPYTEPFIQQDDKYYYHKVEKGETLYSLSRRYGIKVKRILKHNDAYSHNESLAIGAVVRLPLSEIDRSAITRTSVSQVPVMIEKKKEVSQEEVLAGKKKRELQDEGKVEKKKETSREEILGETDTKQRPEQNPDHIQGYRPEREEATGNPETPKNTRNEFSDTLYIQADRSVVLPQESTFSGSYVKVALLLPLYAKDYPWLTDSSNTSVTVSPRSEQFVAFYEGILMALDSLKHKGYRIDLHVFDTERSIDKMYVIAGELNGMKPDLIIGPVYGSVFQAVIENLEDRNIPVVYPLSSRSEKFGQYPNFIQVNASFATLADKMTDWIGHQVQNANIISIDLTANGMKEGQLLGNSEMTENQLFHQKMQQIGGVNFFKWNYTEEPLTALKELLLPDRENIIVLPTNKEAEVIKVLPALAVYTDAYRITVVGFPEWQTFTSVDHETYYKLNTKIFTYSYLDYSAEAVKDFAAGYRKYFYAEPSSLAFKSYDLGLYFIELAARYRERSLDALNYYSKNGVFSRFNFQRMPGQQGWENQGFYIVNYGSDYRLKLEAL